MTLRFFEFRHLLCDQVHYQFVVPKGPEYSANERGLKPKILSTMTVKEAVALWSDPARGLLSRWIEDFNLPLEKLRMNHMSKYQAQRATETDYVQLMAELATLRALLKEAKTGEEIHEAFLTPEEKLALKPDELAALPERVRACIQYLEARNRVLELENRGTRDKLRKANWAKWSRS